MTTLLDADFYVSLTLPLIHPLLTTSFHNQAAVARFSVQELKRILSHVLLFLPKLKQPLDARSRFTTSGKLEGEYRNNLERENDKD